MVRAVPSLGRVVERYLNNVGYRLNGNLSKKALSIN